MQVPALVPACACAQEVRSAVLELVGNLVVVNSAFTHTCLQLLVYSFLPPPSPPAPDAGQGQWQPSEEELDIQATVLSALNKVRRGGGGGDGPEEVCGGSGVEGAC